ncbi:four helix bundle protein [Winogradskyella sp. F6397]|uniref:Four helix bundle protein n=1 Tax=Winogradskyella marina TaxID=2785530 RepID=A0ABS0EEL1_9FLAO|nr:MULTISPECIES: four helix bundle protein [Winogradskyella]MBF8148683.1 four helix bundle protein [Winogradskyella marina]
MKPNIIKEKSFDFAVDIVNVYKELAYNKKEYVMSRQLLKSGTSIGANVREAEFAQSKPDFINKMSISLKEANETDYWIDLLYATNYLNKEEFDKFKPKSQEMLRLLVSIVKSSKD